MDAGWSGFRGSPDDLSRENLTEKPDFRLPKPLQERE